MTPCLRRQMDAILVVVVARLSSIAFRRTTHTHTRTLSCRNMRRRRQPTDTDYLLAAYAGKRQEPEEKAVGTKQGMETEAKAELKLEARTRKQR